MSYVDNKHKKSYVITYKELFFTFAVFATILFALYPKELLKEQIASETSSYELSMLYLENLLQHSPNDESLMLILAEQSLRANEKKRSLSLLNKLIHSPNEEIRVKATLLSYELEKDSYFYLHTEKEKRVMRAKLKQLFTDIYKHKMYKKEDLSKWYRESLFVHHNKATYYFLGQLIKENPSNISYLEQAFYLSQRYNKRKNARKYIRLLQQHDIKNQEKWIYVEYYMYVNYDLFIKAEKLLKVYAKGSTLWTSRLADFYAMRKSFIKASNTYLSIYKRAKDSETQQKYFKKAVGALQAGSKMKEAAALAHQYENLFLDNRKIRNFILKVYVATGNLDYASSLSTKILKRSYR